jgi:Zn-dependent protease
MNEAQILFYLLFIPHVLFAISIHEGAHAYTAYYFGDDTAALMGRVSLNPLRHLDLWGAIAFLIIHFGWAKPVPVNPARLRNPRRDEMLVSLAGPASNFALALLLCLVLRFFGNLMISVGPGIGHTLFKFILIGAQLNAVLGVFNLLPIPPLDGSHILGWFLPYRLAAKYDQAMKYGMFILLGLIALTFMGIPIFSIILGKPMQGFMWLAMGPELYNNIYSPYF